jgi:hypothetical protein
MVHFPGLALTALCVQAAVTGYDPAGFPHSETSESRVVCTSSELIAAYHVLHRLHAPRHPPCALSSLTIKFAHRKNIDQHTKLRLVLSEARASGKTLLLLFGNFAYSIIKDHHFLKLSFAVASLLMRRTFIYYKKRPCPVKTGSRSRFRDPGV